MFEPSELKFSCLTAALKYWGAASPDAPIALVPFPCCKRFVCQCETAEGTSPSESPEEPTNG
jgi:hypothetical protein